MSEDDHPRVTVDDDFLDLRNLHSKPANRKPLSRESTRDSASVTTQGKSSTAKEVLPGLQKLLNTHNKKTCNVGYKRTTGQNQSIDSRFRRKIEKVAFNVRPEIPKPCVEEQIQEQQNQSSETSEEESTLKKDDKCENPPLVQLEQLENEGLKSANSPQVTNYKKGNKNEDKGENLQPILHGKSAQSTKSVKGAIVHFSSNTKKIKYPQEDIADNVSMKSSVKKSTLENDLNWDSEDIKEVTKNKYEPECVVKTVFPKDTLNDTTFQKFNWFNPSQLWYNNFNSLQKFKKSWSIPAVSLIKNTAPLSRQQNTFCTNVDRKFYRFDDADSIDSNEQSTIYSSLFSRNYMNLMFCLGCLCGIFLIAGVLTASQVRSDYCRPSTPRVSLLEFLFREILYSIRLIFETTYQILTFPSTRFFKAPMEPPKPWGVF